MKLRNPFTSVVRPLCRMGLVFAALSGCGKAIPLHSSASLGDAVVGTGGTRTDGSDLGAIYPVTRVIEATGGPAIPGFTAPGDLPFTEAAIAFNTLTTDRQTPFSFSFTFPSNNYQLADAHLVIDTQRDTSDTEGIFVDGVVTGRSPNDVNTASPKVTDRYYNNNGIGNPVNDYYMTFSLAHYRQNTRNTFDLDIAQLLTPSAKTIYSVLSDGFLPVVTADDSPIFQAFLVMDGYTTSREALTCTTAGPYSFQNTFLHNDGNSISAPAFSGTVESPFVSTTSVVAGFKSIEFYFDPNLPRVPIADVTLSTATLSVTVKRDTDLSAIVINGVGVSEAAFDRTPATTAVERWEDGATATTYWNSLLATVPTTSTNTAITIDLIAMLGADTVKTLLAQGKMNIAFAGGIRSVTASNNTSARGLSAPVNGPTLSTSGTYTNEVCDIPDDPDSPLQASGIPPVLPGDVTSPQVISAQATAITSSTATIVWLTDEGATTQVGYGVGNTSTLSANDTTLTTFHEVQLTGLLPYKYYYFVVRTADGNSNQTISSVKVFRTLR